MPHVRALGLLLLCVLVAALLYLGVGDGALLGFDGYPLIAASRVEGAGDLPRVLGDELMGGRYPDGAFYRPIVHLSFTLNDWVGGGSLEAWPFRWTDVLIAAIAASLIGALAARVTGLQEDSQMPGVAGGADAVAAASVAAFVAASVAGLVAAFVFLVHRCQLDVVPYAPRRADALCVLFVAAAALSAIPVLPALSGRRAWSVAALSLAAFFSKETGVIVVPVVAACVFTSRRADDGSARWLIVGASCAAIALGIAIRTAVLGGLGGHPESGTASASEGATEIVATLWQLLAAGVPGGGWLVLGLVVLLLVALGLSGKGGRTAAAIAITWGASALAITVFSGRAHMWYVAALLPSVALVAGASVGLGVKAVAARRPLAMATGVVGLVLAGLLVSVAGTGPQGEALAVAGPVAKDQARRFTELVEQIQPGERLQLDPYVMGVAALDGAPPVFLHAPYSLKALADLLRPDFDIAVVAPGRPASTGAKAVIELIMGPPPVDVLPH